MQNGKMHRKKSVFDYFKGILSFNFCGHVDNPSKIREILKVIQQDKEDNGN